MMFSDEEIKEIPETGFTRPGDEIISIREVCLSDKFYKKHLGFNIDPLLLPNSNRNDLHDFILEGVDGGLAHLHLKKAYRQPSTMPGSDAAENFYEEFSAASDTGSMLRDGFFPDGLEQQQARFAWTEEDIATFVSEPGFDTTVTFGKTLDRAIKSELKEADTSNSVLQPTKNMALITKNINEQQVSSTVSTTSGNSVSGDRYKVQGACKVDATDPRSRYHYVKYVKRHGRTVKLWECGLCSREFQHQYTLMRHLPTHTDERNFHCTECGKSFRQLSTLSQHRAIHSAERPYACEMCNKTFNRVSTLISHRKTHNCEKPYKCHICPKGFHQKGNLRNHLFTHTDERPYRCNICFKGFNQQSNLVCHKNKAHPNDSNPATVTRSRSTPQVHSLSNTQLDSTRPQTEQCEVTSTVGLYTLSSIEAPSSSNWIRTSESEWEIPKSYESRENNNEKYIDWSINNGVIVDPIKTYHMGVALATRQTPFALLKPDNGAPVVVKVVDTNLPGGKQMLVPVTAEDFRIGGKIVIKDEPGESSSISELKDTQNMEPNDAVEIKVPVVAIVVPRIKPGGRLQLTVEEPHHAYHTALPSNSDMQSESCTPNPVNSNALPHPKQLRQNSCNASENGLPIAGAKISSSCTLPPPAPSPPLDFISVDFFEPMECIPLVHIRPTGTYFVKGKLAGHAGQTGPQITAVDIYQPPPADDSNIFIGEFEESIPLSDSD